MPQVTLDYYKSLARYCQSRYYHFVQEFIGVVIKDKVHWNWHIEYLCDQIEESIRDVVARRPRKYDIVCNIPPGTTKSTLWSILPTAYAWTIDPTIRFIGASYTDPLSLELSNKGRQIVESPLYRACWPHIRLRKDTNMKGHWANTLGGDRYSTTVGGSVTGKHAHIISIDDPLDPKGARSEPELLAAEQWCKETIPTRKVDKDISVTWLIMQRLHQKDPTELFLKRGTPVHHICLPGELTAKVRPRSARSKYVDGLLDPTRLSQRVLDMLKLELGVYGYAGQVRQDPVPPEGGMFKTANLMTRTKTPPPLDEFIQVGRFWDKAALDGDGCFTAGVKMGLHKTGQLWVLDVRRGQWGPDEREAIILATAKIDGKHVRIYSEKEGGSAGILDVLMTARGLAGYRYKGVKPVGDKVWRADTYAAQVNAGNVWLATGDWVMAYIDELAHFPFGLYKDQVDASGGIFGELLGKRPRGAL